jgi:hypothetical protein
VNTTAYPASTASADACGQEHPEDLTFLHGEAHVVDGDLLAVPLVQVLNVDHCHVLPPKLR